MDPRHPEEALERIDQLINQFRHILDKLRTEAVSSRLAEAEREGSLVVQEICLVAPRLHEAMMQTSRQRRHDLSHGVLNEPQDTLVEMPHDGYLSVDEAIEEKLVEKDVNEIPEKVDIEEPDVNEKPKKKTTRKKKTTKKEAKK